MFLAMGLFVVLAIFDPSVRSGKEQEKKLKLPLLAAIPIIGNNREIPYEIESEKREIREGDDKQG